MQNQKSTKTDMRRSPGRRTFTLAVVAISAIAIMVALYACTTQPDIWVTGLNTSETNSFNFSIRNHRIMMTGAINKFSVPCGKEKFFNELKRSYKVFNETGERIQLIYNNEIYTVKSYGRYYALYGEYFIFEQNDNVYYFPFPTDKIVGVNEPIPRFSSGFKMNCDSGYLQRFYEVYGSAVHIDKNVIHYKNLTLTIVNNEITINILR